jgi:tectonic-1/3
MRLHHRCSWSFVVEKQTSSHTDTERQTHTVVSHSSRKQSKFSPTIAIVFGIITLCFYTNIFSCIEAQPSTLGYTVDWSSVPATQPAALDTNDRDVGPCICDMRVSECDRNCYCDSDCDATIKLHFSESEEQGPKTTSVSKCIDPDLVKVNERGGITTSLVNNLLCVEKENNPSDGDFFIDPGTVSDAQIETYKRAQPYTLQEDDQQSATTVATIANAATPTDGGYLVGDPIIGARGSLASLTATTGGLFPVPARGFSQECNSLNAARFMQTTPPSVTYNDPTSAPDLAAARSHRCSRVTATLSTDCAAGSVYDVATYVTGLFAGQTQSSTPASPSGYVGVTLRSLSSRDATTLVETALSTATPYPVPTFASPSCTNAVLDVKYTFAFTTAGAITAVYADVVVGTASATVVQSFTTSFDGSGRSRAGNPGYRTGQPVLAGTHLAFGAKTAINQFKTGLEVLGHTAAGLCSASGPFFSPIKFGQDVRLTCDLSLTSTTLATTCVSGISPQLLNISATYIGMFGNSDYLYSSQWTPVLFVDLSSSGTWSATDQTCTGIVNGIDIEFITADVGAVLNPQRKIVRVRVRKRSSTWRYRNRVTTTAELFPVSVTASFVHIPASVASDVIRSAPPLIPELPRDVLYPLYMPDSAAPSQSTVAPVLLYIILGLWCLLSMRWVHRE